MLDPDQQLSVQQIIVWRKTINVPPLFPVIESQIIELYERLNKLNISILEASMSVFPHKYDDSIHKRI